MGYGAIRAFKSCVPHVCWAGERQLLTSAVPLLPHAASLSCSVSSLARVPAPQTTWPPLAPQVGPCGRRA